MEIHLRNSQLVKAIVDDGVSMYFRGDPASNQLSRRVILSAEVAPPTTLLTNPGQPEKAQKGKRRKHCKTPGFAVIRGNACLGQACHSRFNDVMPNKSQEVFSQSLTLTVVLCNSYPTCENILILRQVTQSISHAHFRTWRKVRRKVSNG